MAQPTVGRQVAALEEELGITLFERIGQGLKLTTAGLDLLEHVRAMGESAAQVSLAAAGNATALKGEVVIAASEATAVHLLPPAIERVRREHPGIQVEVIASNTPQDLRSREADIAVRNFRPTDTALVARKIGESKARLYATPAYLASVGDPRTLAGLSRATFLGFDRGEALMKGLNALGLSLTPDSFRLVSGSQLVQWALACRGLGVCIMMEEIGDEEPAVVRVLPDTLLPIPVPVWLTTHREVHTSKRVRVVFDVLAEALTEVVGPL